MLTLTQTPTLCLTLPTLTLSPYPHHTPHFVPCRYSWPCVCMCVQSEMCCGDGFVSVLLTSQRSKLVGLLQSQRPVTLDPNNAQLHHETQERLIICHGTPLLLLQLFYGPLSRTTRVSWYQKDEPF